MSVELLVMFISLAVTMLIAAGAYPQGAPSGRSPDTLVRTPPPG